MVEGEAVRPEAVVRQVRQARAPRLPAFWLQPPSLSSRPHLPVPLRSPVAPACPWASSPEEWLPEEWLPEERLPGEGLPVEPPRWVPVAAAVPR